MKFIKKKKKQDCGSYTKLIKGKKQNKLSNQPTRIVWKRTKL